MTSSENIGDVFSGTVNSVKSVDKSYLFDKDGSENNGGFVELLPAHQVSCEIVSD
jgi:hypothetical protein